MKIASMKRTIADVRALGTAAPVRALYEMSKRTNFHRVLFRSSERHSFRSRPLSIGLPTTGDEEARRRCLEDAAVIRAQGARVFGNRAETGFHASWHSDPLSGQEWPRLPWWQIDIRSDRRLSDVKYVWEAARHRDLVILARAATLEPDGEWLNMLIAALERWCEENPPEWGVNWYSSLELALRAIAWTQVLYLIGDDLPAGLRRAMDDQLVASARHIVTELPYTVSSMKNNHMLGDALGLIVLARLFPDHPRHNLWTRIGERLFRQQLSRHMRPDGSMVEDSLSYHRFVLEMLIVRFLLGDASSQVTRAMHGAAVHLQRIGVFDSELPQYGDWDEGRVLASSGDASDVAGSAALALVLSGAELPTNTEERYDELAWYASRRHVTPTRGTANCNGPATESSPVRGEAAAPQVSASGGIAYVQRGPWSLWFKAGSAPSHGHADLSSIWVQHDGNWLISDPGTGTYNGPIVIRNGLRTSAAHPVVRPDNRDQLGPHRAFRWQRHAKGQLACPVQLADCTVLFGWHNAYATAEDPIRIARTVLVGDDYIAVIDLADHDRAAWHLTVPLHPGIQVDGSILQLPGLSLPSFGLDQARPVLGQENPYAGWHSVTYGETEPAVWLVSELGATDRHVWGIGDVEVDTSDSGIFAGGHHFEVEWQSGPRLTLDGMPIDTSAGAERANLARRVLVLNHFAVPRGEPGGTRHVEMFSRLREWRHLILASRLNLTTGKPQTAEPGFKPVWVSPYRGNGISRVLNWCTYLLSSLTAAIGVIRTRPDVVYASSPHLLAGASGYLLSRVYRRPFILEIRDIWPQILVDMGSIAPDSMIFRALRSLERFLYQRADAIVTMASGTGTYLQQLGVPRTKVHYIPNGADPSEFTPSEQRDELRARYGFSRFTAVYTGAHGPANGLDALLEAAENLRSAEVDIVLVGDGTEKGRLRKAAVRRRLDNLRFLDPVPKTEIPDLLHAADAGLHILEDVSLFRSAVSPNKLFDYMAAGLPVLTNSGGVVEEWVTDADAGWYVPTDELAVKLASLSKCESESLQVRGARGRAWIEEHQSRSAMATRLARVLSGVVQEQPSTANAPNRSVRRATKEHDVEGL